MRILHISSATSWRGGEQQIAYLIDGLRELDIENFLLCPSDAPLIQKIEHCTSQIFNYNKKRSFDFSVSQQITEICTSQNIDGIHIHDSHSHNYVWSSFLFYKLTIPACISRRVDFPVKKISRLKYNHDGFKKIICISDAIRRILLPSIKDTSKLITIHSGVDTYIKPDLSFSLSSKYNINPDKKCIGMVAAIAPHKDFTTFVKTAIQYEADNPDQAVFFIIGADGGEMSKIKTIIEKNQATSYIMMTGHIENVKTIIHGLDVFLFTSKEEGLGTSILDAIIAGIPVVATKAGGIPEIITHAFSGLLADIGDYTTLSNHIRHIITKRSYGETLAKNAQTQIKHFAKERMVLENYSVYQEIF